MAQALLNNLTNIGKEIYSCSDLQDIPSDVDFEQILDSKTKNIFDFEQKSSSETENNNLNVQTNLQNTEDITNIVDSTAIENSTESLASVLEETTLAAAIEMAVDTVTDSSSGQINDNNNNDNNGDVLESEENTDTEDSDTEKSATENTTTITENEDPTMNNKQLQTALENPTTLIVLQPQTNLKNQNENNASNEANIPTERQISYSDKTETSLTEIFTLAESKKTTQKESTQNPKTLKEIVNEKVLRELNVESVSASEEGGSSSDIMQYQTPQEQAVKVMLHGDIKFDEIKDISMQNQIKQTETSTGRIIEQITKQMEGMYNTSKVNIILNPASLGKVVLQLINSKEGLTAHFTVTNSDTQNALMRGLAGLKESLLAQGISVDNIVVKLSESELSDNEQKQDWTEQEHSAGGNKGQGSRKQKQEKKNFEQMMFEINQA